ncbi:hypothetical protein B0T19DRAFT_98674 [Cercophora scortea]|uniref:Uncharacterized protein n=1 Tax=Cercophora scortea TaxID=314031 RepID=A0AAE0IXB3_9PEZI|nr:hypothetical protein B0T19DRAFT_98674 [Cercophora scortea]
MSRLTATRSISLESDRDHSHSIQHFPALHCSHFQGSRLEESAARPGRRSLQEHLSLLEGTMDGLESAVPKLPSLMSRRSVQHGPVQSFSSSQCDPASDAHRARRASRASLPVFQCNHDRSPTPKFGWRMGSFPPCNSSSDATRNPAARCQCQRQCQCQSDLLSGQPRGPPTSPKRPGLGPGARGDTAVVGSGQISLPTTPASRCQALLPVRYTRTSSNQGRQNLGLPLAGTRT